MTIKVDGKIIYYENLDDLDKCFHLLCKCGHELYQHAFSSSHNGMIFVSQCVICGIVDGWFKCDGFKHNDSN